LPGLCSRGHSGQFRAIVSVDACNRCVVYSQGGSGSCPAGTAGAWSAVACVASAVPVPGLDCDESPERKQASAPVQCPCESPGPVAEDRPGAAGESTQCAVVSIPEPRGPKSAPTAWSRAGGQPAHATGAPARGRCAGRSRISSPGTHYVSTHWCCMYGQLLTSRPPRPSACTRPHLPPGRHRVPTNRPARHSIPHLQPARRRPVSPGWPRHSDPAPPGSRVPSCASPARYPRQSRRTAGRVARPRYSARRYSSSARRSAVPTAGRTLPHARTEAG